MIGFFIKLIVYFSDLSGLIKIYQDLSGFIRINRDLSGLIKIYLDLSGFGWIWLDLAGLIHYQDFAYGHKFVCTRGVGGYDEIDTAGHPLAVHAGDIPLSLAT